MNSEPTVEDTIKAVNAQLQFMNDVNEEWAALSEDRRFQIVRDASSGGITTQDLDLLVRRNVYMLVGTFHFDLSRLITTMFEGIKNPDVRMIIVVEVVRIMDALASPNDDNSQASEIREKYWK